MTRRNDPVPASTRNRRIEIDMTTPEGPQALQDALSATKRTRVRKHTRADEPACQQPAPRATRGAGPRYEAAIRQGWQFGVTATPEGERGYAWRGALRSPLFPVGAGRATSPLAAAGEQWRLVIDWIEQEDGNANGIGFDK